MKTILLITLLGISTVALAKKDCTDAPKGEWMTEKAFKEKAISEGYKIKKFKTPGTCYEIYGTDKDGVKVEVYFNPVDGSVVKRKLDK